VDDTTNFFATKISHMYLDAEHSTTTKNDVTDLLFYLRKAFKEIIGENEWMDEGDKIHFDRLISMVFFFVLKVRKNGRRSSLKPLTPTSLPTTG